MTAIKVLIVEDEELIASDIAIMLGKKGYTVTGIVGSGEQAIEEVSQSEPDLILMDIVLEGRIDGVEAAEIIKKKSNIPIIYLTAYSDEETVKRAARTDPFGYLLKPFNERELFTNIEIALYKHQLDLKLQEKEQWLATILGSISDGIIVIDSDCLVVFISPIAQKMIGCNQEDALGKDITELFNLLDENTREPINILGQSEESDSSSLFSMKELILVPKDRPEIFIECGFTISKGFRRRMEGLILIFRNISAQKRAEKNLEKVRIEQKKTEEKLSRSKETINSIIASIPVGTIMLDRSLNEILLINEQAVKILDVLKIDIGYSTLVAEFVTPNLDDINLDMDKRYELTQSDKFYGYSLYQVGDDYVCIYIRDLTEQKRMESIAESINITQNINIIFSSIRHEIGNPLSILKTSLTVLQKNIDTFDIQKKNTYFERLMTAINSMEDLLSQLRSYHIFQDFTLARVDLVPLINRCHDQFCDQLELKGIHCSFETEHSHCFIMGNKHVLLQVFINLIKNAIEALEDTEKPVIILTLTRTESHYIISITDNGNGIDEHDLPYIFTPFYTRKKGGTGLGLAIVKKIVTQMHGTVKMESEQGQGTRVLLSFNVDE